MSMNFEYVQGIPRHLNDMLRRLFSQTLPFLRDVQITVPTTDTLPDGWACLYDDGTNRRIYVNISGTIRQWDSD